MSNIPIKKTLQPSSTKKFDQERIQKFYNPNYQSKSTKLQTSVTAQDMRWERYFKSFIKKKNEASKKKCARVQARRISMPVTLFNLETGVGNPISNKIVSSTSLTSDSRRSSLISVAHSMISRVESTGYPWETNGAPSIYSSRQGSVSSELSQIYKPHEYRNSEESTEEEKKFQVVSIKEEKESSSPKSDIRRKGRKFSSASNRSAEFKTDQKNDQLSHKNSPVTERKIRKLSMSGTSTLSDSAKSLEMKDLPNLTKAYGDICVKVETIKVSEPESIIGVTPIIMMPNVNDRITLCFKSHRDLRDKFRPQEGDLPKES